MQKIILFVNVQDDGVGDFYHLADICGALLNNANLKDYEFVPIIAYGIKHSKSTVDRFREALENMHVTTYFMYPAFRPCLIDGDIGPMPGYSSEADNGQYYVGSNREFVHNVLIQQQLATAAQILIVSSYAGIPIKFREYASKEAVFKFIGEHEWKEPMEKAQNYSLGLRDDAYGLKLKKMEKISLDTAMQIFDKKDNDFYKILHGIAHTATNQEFAEHNILIPAYFNNLRPVKQLLLFLVKNKRMSPTTNININLTGNSLEYFILYNEIPESWIAILGDTNIQQITLCINGTENPIVHQINAAGTRSLRIFIGFYLSSLSFQAIQQQALISGVSGDTSLELALGLSLPFYHSTNASAKRDTFLSLEKICDSLDLPQQLKADYKLYFGSLGKWDERDDIKNVFEELDLPNMINSWHILAAYLFKHYNFYDKLEEILLSKPVVTNKGSIERLIQSSDSHKRCRLV